MSLLRFENVSFEKENKYILKDLYLEINYKDFISVIGHSGSGKSTFFKLCSQLITPTNGNIFYKGVSCNKYDPIELRKQISYCLQTPCLFGNTVIDNLRFPFSIRHKDIDLNIIKNLLEIFKMSPEYLSRKIENLSGGEKQRIALIRSLIFTPEILLLDEVTSALDEENTFIVENAVTSLNENGTTILWITHSIDQAKKYSNKILTIEYGELKSLEVIK